MDESWRILMGIPTFPRRKSTETNTPMGHMKAPLFFGCCATETLDADDFSDVFGGPPRIRGILNRNFSGDFMRSPSFYEEVFSLPDFTTRALKIGKSLPSFRIPARNEGFYSDIFGSYNYVSRSRDRSRSNSKTKSNSNSSSALSSEELSPLRPPAGADVALSSFASKLRPINVPCRWNSNEQQRKEGTMPAFPCNQFMENEYEPNFRASYHEFTRRTCSPETISLERNSFQSIKVSTDDFVVLNSPPFPTSPASSASSLCQESEARSSVLMQDQDTELEDDEDMSSYVIEIKSEYREVTSEAVSIDEAIAWAKEKSQTQFSPRRHEEEHSGQAGKTSGNGHQFLDQTHGNGTKKSPFMEGEQKWKSEEKELSKEQMEMELMDEDIKRWSSGKENNIRLLLSTMHNILWPNSGWHVVPLTSLADGLQVKKAYQKARLCLHPDKLQQRGATLSQKYVAEKVFSVLQDAWAAFVSQDVFFS
ncbi:hypothetical protein SLEP1_g44987 [Rubroshorea leprosula]|uniref:Auxilin-related protein 2 n=1 Tax=Rubroshorea leprosula TaxID=152421 RepID=A0AAV5LJ64_9ROSI|nr:hypothetical protein SLEP1_g44987 [Rubroshorea leprosula]